MKKYLAVSVALLIAVSVGVSTVQARHAGRKTVKGDNPGQGGGNSNAGNSFGSYVSTLTGANIPYAMDKLGFDFGKNFVAPYTPGTNKDSNIEQIGYDDKAQWWVISPEEHTAVQWYT